VTRDLKNGKSNPEYIVTKRLLFVDRLLCNQECVETLAQRMYWHFKMLISLHIYLYTEFYHIVVLSITYVGLQQNISFSSCDDGVPSDFIVVAGVKENYRHFFCNI